MSTDEKWVDIKTDLEANVIWYHFTEDNIILKKEDYFVIFIFSWSRFNSVKPHLTESIRDNSTPLLNLSDVEEGGHRVVVSTTAFHARVRGSFPGIGGLKETKMFHPHPLVKLSIAGSLRDREVACSGSDRQGSNFESCVWRTASSHSSHHPQEVLQFSLYVQKGGLKPDSFHFIFVRRKCDKTR